MTAIRMLVAAALGAAFVASGAARADEALARKHNCTACHQVDRKSVGPSYKDVANKYRGQADAGAKLSAHVKSGSKGLWGPIPMPPNAAVPDADIDKLVKWVLAM